MKPIPANAVVRWAVHPSDTGKIKYIDGLWEKSHTLPYENDIITRPFLVDPVTNQPIPVRVAPDSGAFRNDTVYPRCRSDSIRSVSVGFISI